MRSVVTLGQLTRDHCSVREVLLVRVLNLRKVFVIALEELQVIPDTEAFRVDFAKGLIANGHVLCELRGRPPQLVEYRIPFDLRLIARAG